MASYPVMIDISFRIVPSTDSDLFKLRTEVNTY